MTKLSELLDKYLNDNDIKLREFADRCGLSHSYIAKLRHGYDSRSKKPIEPTIDTLNKIAIAMNITLEELLLKADLIDDTAMQAVKENPASYMATTKTESEKLADEILQILFDTHQITKEERNTGKLDPKKKEKLFKRVKKFIEFAGEIDKI